MSSELLAPEGTKVQGNYSRYAGAAADDLLTQFASAPDLEQQMQVAAALQSVFAQEVHVVPLATLGGMGLVITSRFTGFPTAENYCASAQPNGLVLLRRQTVFRSEAFYFTSPRLSSN